MTTHEIMVAAKQLEDTITKMCDQDMRRSHKPVPFDQSQLADVMFAVDSMRRILELLFNAEIGSTDDVQDVVMNMHDKVVAESEGSK